MLEIIPMYSSFFVYYFLLVNFVPGTFLTGDKNVPGTFCAVNYTSFSHIDLQ